MKNDHHFIIIIDVSFRPINVNCLCKRQGITRNIFLQEKVEAKMTLEDAIKMIQIHERARQGRLRAKFRRGFREQEEREAEAATRGAPTLDPDVAATIIQKVQQFTTACCCQLLYTIPILFFL